MGYCEDEEIGVGQQLLEQMTKNDITHRGVFIVRYCGEKLHNERIPSYVKAMEAIIKQSSFNPALNREQVFEVGDLMDSNNRRGGRLNNRRGASYRGQGGRGRGGQNVTPRKYSPPIFKNHRTATRSNTTDKKQVKVLSITSGQILRRCVKHGSELNRMPLS